jgi:hypothetical protein
MLQNLLNLTDYTALEHLFFSVGCLGWVFTYLIVIRNIIRHRFVEVPVVAVCANFAWEFLWSFVFLTDMGLLYVWGYRIWFFLDCFIVFGLFRYGMKQYALKAFARHHFWIVLVTLLAWFVMLYYFILGYDVNVTGMGANSGYVLNVMMSALYIPLLMRLDSREVFSYAAAWFKGVGTLLISIFCFLHFTDGFLLAMCLVTAGLDAVYIGIFTFRRARAPAMIA